MCICTLYPNLIHKDVSLNLRLYLCNVVMPFFGWNMKKKTISLSEFAILLRNQKYIKNIWKLKTISKLERNISIRYALPRLAAIKIFTDWFIILFCCLKTSTVWYPHFSWKHLMNVDSFQIQVGYYATFFLNWNILNCVKVYEMKTVWALNHTLMKKVRICTFYKSIICIVEIICCFNRSN